MFKTTKTALSLAVLVAVAMSSPASAAVLTSTLNVGGSSPGINGNYGNWFGISFTTDGNPWTLDNLVLRLENRGASTSFFAAIHSASGLNPGTLLEALSGSNNPPTGNSTYTSTGLALAANTTYFVVTGLSDSGDGGSIRAIQTSLDTEDGPGTIGDDTRLSQNQGASWASWSGESSRFEVNATQIPEPATLSLVAMGVLGLIARKKRA